MGLKKLMSDYAEFNSWANQRVADWLSEKPDEVLYKELPSSFSTIVRTAYHMWEAEEYWYALITETAENRLADINDLSKGEVFEGLLNKSTQLLEAINSYTDDDLVRVIVPPNPEFQCPLPRYQFIQHIFNHQTYHRGQIVTMGRALGIFDAPTTDYNIFHDPV